MFHQQSHPGSVELLERQGGAGGGESWHPLLLDGRPLHVELSSRVLPPLETGDGQARVVRSDEGAVAEGVGLVPCSLAPGADEGAEDGTGNQTGLSPQLVTLTLLDGLAIVVTKLA